MDQRIVPQARERTTSFRSIGADRRQREGGAVSWASGQLQSARPAETIAGMQNIAQGPQPASGAASPIRPAQTHSLRAQSQDVPQNSRRGRRA